MIRPSKNIFICFSIVTLIVAFFFRTAPSLAQDIFADAGTEASVSSVEEVAPPDQNFQTETVTFSFIEPSAVVSILQTMVSGDGKVVFGEAPNTVVLTDTPAKIEEMKQYIKEADVQRFTMVFELGYAKASDLKEKVEGLLTKDVGRVKVDESSNKLIITDTSAKIEEVRKIVDQIDRRDRQVLIEAKIVQISLNDEHRMGVDWEAIVSDYHSLKFTGQFSNLPEGEKQGQLSIGTIANEDFAILIEALDTVGSVAMLSNPSITAVHNKEARILAGATQPYVPQAGLTSPAGLSTTGESVNFIDVGARFFITPTIYPDGSLTMKIRPEVSSVAGNAVTGTNIIPVVETSEAETTVNIKEGVTIVIGGLIKEERSRLTKKVPILGDVPFLGMAFRSYSHSVKKTEIVTFLIPKFVADD